MPPVDSVLDPASTITLPPSNEPMEEPTDNLISPALPSVEAPVLNVNLPELASFEEPVDIEMFPLAPSAPALEDKISIEPLPCSVLPPLRTMTSPPLL